MMALRFNVPGKTADQIIGGFSAYDKCGAQVYISNEGESVLVEFPGEQFPAIEHCLEGSLDATSKAMFEHALSMWDMEYNHALDELAEDGMSKSDPQAQKAAEDIAYASITGNVPPAEFKLGNEVLGVYHEPM